MKLLSAATLTIPAFSAFGQQSSGSNARMDKIAESYVKLVLAVGQHDPDYVDAYYGPPEWQTAAKGIKMPLADIKAAASHEIVQLRSVAIPRSEEMLQLRHQYLTKQLQSLIARADMLAGKKLSFDQEAKALYDADPPAYPESHFAKLSGQLEQILPGEGSVAQRYQQFKNGFIIPGDNLDAVFKAAITEARRRTKSHIDLPAGESFVVEYVQDKAWGGYNWYKGNYHSVIQVNTDLPIYIDYAVLLACHEGYPGHHVYNTLLEDNLLRKKNWAEFSVYPLFSPQSLIAEGTANYGIEVAFPETERVAFERKVLFPLAGLDPTLVEKYYKVAGLVAKMNFAMNEAARGILDGSMTAEEAMRWLESYALLTRERARRQLRFIEQYRSYVINYNYGLELIKEYLESRGGTADNPNLRWKEFTSLISSPRLPSSLH